MPKSALLVSIINRIYDMYHIISYIHDCAIIIICIFVQDSFIKELTFTQGWVVDQSAYRLRPLSRNGGNLTARESNHCLLVHVTLKLWLSASQCTK